MKDKMFGMISVCALCNDITKPVITIPNLDKSGEDVYISYEVNPISCSIAGYQPVRLRSCVDGYGDIDVSDGVLDVHLGKEHIQIQFSWENEYDEGWREYETDMLNITYLF